MTVRCGGESGPRALAGVRELFMNEAFDQLADGAVHGWDIDHTFTTTSNIPAVPTAKVSGGQLVVTASGHVEWGIEKTVSIDGFSAERPLLLADGRLYP